jgi:hypothetical protein
MSQLKFESFTNENEKVQIISPQSGVTGQKNYTYLDEFAVLQKNESILTKYAVDFSERATAKFLCDKINEIPNQNSTPYSVKNKYITGNNQTPVSIGFSNRSTYQNQCSSIINWGTAPNTPVTFNITYPMTSLTDTDVNGYYTNIQSIYGRNIVTDISCINSMTSFSNSMIKDLSDNYQSSRGNLDYINNIKKYNDTVKKRQKLDMAMVELYNGDQSIAMYQKKSLDSVVYANILWTILATSLIYYIFVKI